MHVDTEMRRWTLQELVCAERAPQTIDDWFEHVAPRHYKKKTQLHEERVFSALSAHPANREALLAPYLAKKQSRVPFNSAHVAALRGTDEAFAVAVRHKADMGAVWRLATPMMLAAGCGHRSFVDRLLDHGVDYEEVKGNMGIMLSPLTSAIRGGHHEVIERLVEFATPKSFTEAAAMGDLRTMQLLHGKVQVPDVVTVPSEDVAVKVLEALPDVPPFAVRSRMPGGVDLARALLRRQPHPSAEQIAGQMQRLDAAALELLFDACTDLTARFAYQEGRTNLAELALNASAAVVASLVGRGVELDVDAALERSFLKDDVRGWLGAQAAGDFFDAPYADGFRGRFREGFLGVQLGAPVGGAKPPAGIRLDSEGGVVAGIHFEATEVPGDAFGVIAEELDQRMGARVSEERGHIVWIHDGVRALLRSTMEDWGRVLTLTVDRASEQDTSRIAVEVEAMFPELEEIEVRRENQAFVVAADVRGQDDAVVISWPSSPWSGKGLDPAFVEAVQSDLQRHTQPDW